MTKKLEHYLHLNSILTKVKASRGGVISHEKVTYTDHEIDSAKKVLNRILTSSNEVSRIKAKVLIVQENGDG